MNRSDIEDTLRSVVSSYIEGADADFTGFAAEASEVIDDLFENHLGSPDFAHLSEVTAAKLALLAADQYLVQAESSRKAVNDLILGFVRGAAMALT